MQSADRSPGKQAALAFAEVNPTTAAAADSTSPRRDIGDQACTYEAERQAANRRLSLCMFLDALVVVLLLLLLLTWLVTTLVHRSSLG